MSWASACLLAALVLAAIGTLPFAWPGQGAIIATLFVVLTIFGIPLGAIRQMAKRTARSEFGAPAGSNAEPVTGCIVAVSGGLMASLAFLMLWQLLNFSDVPNPAYPPEWLYEQHVVLLAAAWMAGATLLSTIALVLIKGIRTCPEETVLAASQPPPADASLTPDR
jgi:hypothetical protein